MKNKKVIVTFTILATLISALVYIVNTSSASSQQQKDELSSFNYSSIPNGCSSAVFNGTSMQPTIMKSDTVIGCPADEYVVKKGDIVCYNIKDYCERQKNCPISFLAFKYNCHRIVDIAGEYYIAKGDSCKFPWCSATEKVKKEEIEYLIVGVLN